jgi:hypothetical protein
MGMPIFSLLTTDFSGFSLNFFREQSIVANSRRNALLLLIARN